MSTPSNAAQPGPGEEPTPDAVPAAVPAPGAAHLPGGEPAPGATPAPGVLATPKVELAPAKPTEDQSVGELFAGVSRNLSVLVHQEIDLAKAEIKASATKAGIGAGLFAAAAFFAFFILIMLSFAMTYGFHALGMALGFAFLCSAGVFIILAGICVLIGARNLKKISGPERAQATSKASIDAVKEAFVRGFARKP